MNFLHRSETPVDETSSRSCRICHLSKIGTEAAVLVEKMGPELRMSQRAGPGFSKNTILGDRRELFCRHVDGDAHADIADFSHSALHVNGSIAGLVDGIARAIRKSVVQMGL